MPSMKFLQRTMETQRNSGGCRARVKLYYLFFALNQHEFSGNIQLSLCPQVLYFEHSGTWKQYQEA
jgi:hypothetical protein